MQFFALVALLAAAATAAPGRYNGKADSPFGSLTVQEANGNCGSGNTISCCNDSETHIGSNENGGVLGNALHDGLLSGCSAIPIDVIGVANNLLQDHCTVSAACCNNNQISQNGLVNVGCLPLNLDL